MGRFLTQSDPAAFLPVELAEVALQQGLLCTGALERLHIFANSVLVPSDLIGLALQKMMNLQKRKFNTCSNA